MENHYDKTISETHRLIERERFQSVMSRFASGVGIVTTRSDGIDYGLTASAITSLSIDPPMLLICVQKTSNTYAALSESQVFAVNILREEQSDLARHFATSQPGKFEGQNFSYGELGIPVLDTSLAVLECRVTDIVSAGTHSIFLAEVLAAQGVDAMPLMYFRGRVGSFSFLGTDTRKALWKYMQWEE